MVIPTIAIVKSRKYGKNLATHSCVSFNVPFVAQSVKTSNLNIVLDEGNSITYVLRNSKTVLLVNEFRIHKLSVRDSE